MDQLLAYEDFKAGPSQDTQQLYWTLTDHQGSVRDVLWENTGGQQTAKFEYDAFGTPHLAGASELLALPANLYAAREYDSETGLYYNRARYYDPTAGRFLSEDPLGYSAGDTNLYRYAFNSPTHFTDPSGNVVITSAIAIGAAIYYGGGALIGAAHGIADTVAANPEAGFFEYAVSATLGATFGAINPAGELASASGAIIGGAIEAYSGGEFLGKGFQAGGLIGGVAGGFGTAARTAVRQSATRGTRHLIGVGLRSGATSVAPEAIGATIGAGAGYLETGTFEGTLHRAQQGLFVGGITQGVAGFVKRRAAARVGGTNLLNELALPKKAQRSLLREAMQSNGTGKIAHHLVPLESLTEYNSLMQRAARGGFNINGKNNGILLHPLDHIGGHPGYNRIVLEELSVINRQARRLSNTDVAELIQSTANTLRQASDNNTFRPWF